MLAFGTLPLVSTESERRATTGGTTLDALLLGAKLIDETALREAMRVARRRRTSLLEVLIDEHLVDDALVADALARHLGLPRVALSSTTLDDEAIREVPHDLATAHLVMPIQLEIEGGRRTLRLAMANPLDLVALDDVAHSSACVIEPAVASVSEVRGAIQRSYRGFITKMIPRLSNEDGRTTAPSTQPHLQLPDESSIEVRMRALMEILIARGIMTRAELDEKIRHLVSGDDV